MTNLYFDYVTMRNFLSFGNDAFTFHFKPGVHLVVGPNGTGKSNVLQATPFALYGKTPRKLPKQHLVNDVNRAKCSVSSVFHTDDSTFEVARFIKPDNMEILKDGSLIDSQRVRQYQKFLEGQILGEINLPLFNDLIFISINKTQPFLSLGKWQKREFIESLFSFSIYSDLYRYTFEKEKPYQTRKAQTETGILALRKLIEDKELTIRRLNRTKKEQESATNDRIEKLEQEITKNTAAVADQDALSKEYDFLNNQVEDTKGEIREARDLNIKLNGKIEHAAKEIGRLKSIEENTDCSECKRELPEEILKDRQVDISKKIAELADKIEGWKKHIRDYETIQGMEQEKDELLNTVTEIQKKLSLIKHVAELLEDQEKELSKLKDTDTGVDELIEKTKAEVAEYEDKISMHEANNKKYSLYLNYLNVVKESLKDEEIKRWALRKIRPYINQKVNEYLEETNSDYRILFDDEFEPQFSSRAHYESFSEGEKKKLDLAIIFAFRDRLFSQKGVFCDLLFIDEFLDSSLDSEAVEKVLELIKLKQQKDNLKVYITTHNKDITSDFFDTINRAEKKIFTTIREE